MKQQCMEAYCGVSQEAKLYDDLFEGLPNTDANIPYESQSELLQVCNLALLDEIKRLENENREMRSIARVDEVKADHHNQFHSVFKTNPQEPNYLQANHQSHHIPTPMFAFEQK